MKRSIVTFAALMLMAGAAFSQIRPKQIGWPPSDTAVYVIVNDTAAGPMHNLGKWWPVDSLGLGGGGSPDADFWKRGTTSPPYAITDTMYHTGVTGVGENTSAAMVGQLTVGPDGGTTHGLAMTGFFDSTIPIGMYQATASVGWRLRLVDDNSFYLEEVFGGTPFVPFYIETQTPTGTLTLQGDGDVQIGDYPNTRDDGTPVNVLGTTAAGVIQSYPVADLPGAAAMDNWLLAASGTAGTESITDNETVTIAGAGINVATRVGSTVTITGTEVDGSTTNEIQDITVTGASQPFTLDLSSDATDATMTGAGITTLTRSGNDITITSTEVDGSTTNEIQTLSASGTTTTYGIDLSLGGGSVSLIEGTGITIDRTGNNLTLNSSAGGVSVEEGNVLVQSGNTSIDFQTMFDVATDGASEVNVSLDLSEATTVTTPETDDYIIMHDAGLAQHQKILATDMLEDVLTIRESNTAVGTGNDLDFGSGFDVTGTGPTFDIDLDLSEFTTDAVAEGDEYVIVFDPSTNTEEKIPVGTIGGTDTNFAENDLTFSGNRTHDMGIYTLDLSGSVMNMTLRDVNGSTGKNLEITSELGASNGVTGGISFTYETSGTPTDQYEIQAYKRTSTKQTLQIIAKQDTDAEITYEKNSGFSANTTQSHVAINGGVAFTQNYEWTGTGSDLTIDRSYHILNVSGAGSIGDEIWLPEVLANTDGWSGAIGDAQVQVGQEYVVTNFRAATNLVIRTFSGDIINDNEGGSGATYTLGPGTSVILKCVRYNAGVGYWYTYD